jgi:transcriptional regulator CtsR
MSRLSDIIEQFIKELMMDAQTNMLEIQRNELADHFNCAPSHINYVLSTRFSIEKGYYIESRRGGGGFIRIQKLDAKARPYLGRIVFEYIGDSISQHDAKSILASLEERGIVTPRERLIMDAAVNSKGINVFSPSKDIVRAGILKSMLSVFIID